MSINKINESIIVYRKFSRLIYQFPNELQSKLRYNLKEAFDINKYLIKNNEIKNEDINNIITQSNSLYSLLSSMSKEKELFSELLKPLDLSTSQSDSYKYNFVTNESIVKPTTQQQNQTQDQTQNQKLDLFTLNKKIDKFSKNRMFNKKKKSHSPSPAPSSKPSSKPSSSLNVNNKS